MQYSQQKRLFLAVILQALKDLVCSNEHLNHSAERFLLNETGALGSWCATVDLPVDTFLRWYTDLVESDKVHEQILTLHRVLY